MNKKLASAFLFSFILAPALPANSAGQPCEAIKEIGNWITKTELVQDNGDRVNVLLSPESNPELSFRFTFGGRFVSSEVLLKRRGLRSDAYAKARPITQSTSMVFSNGDRIDDTEVYDIWEKYVQNSGRSTFIFGEGNRFLNSFISSKSVQTTIKEIASDNSAVEYLSTINLSGVQRVFDESASISGQLATMASRGECSKRCVMLCE
ncbi:MAG: hypothetical protein AAGA28_14650 [Pseudomonadota bacterium]